MDPISFKSKIGDKEVDLMILPESLSIQKKCDLEYYLAFGILLRKGLLPRSAMEKVMADNGIWTIEHENMVKDLQAKIIALELKLGVCNTAAEGLPIADALADSRRVLYRLIETKTGILENCCESACDIVRQEAYIAYATVYKDTRKPVYRDYSDFLSRKDDQVSADAEKAFMGHLKASFISTIESLPESKFVDLHKKVEEAANAS